jgi:hypothetical protein
MPRFGVHQRGYADQRHGRTWYPRDMDRKSRVAARGASVVVAARTDVVAAGRCFDRGTDARAIAGGGACGDC